MLQTNHVEQNQVRLIVATAPSELQRLRKMKNFGEIFPLYCSLATALVIFGRFWIKLFNILVQKKCFKLYNSILKQNWIKLSLNPLNLMANFWLKF